MLSRRLLRLARHQHKHIGIITAMDQRRGAITGPLMGAVRNIAAAAATGTAMARATATPGRRQAGIIGVIRSASPFLVVARATGYLRQPSVHTILPRCDYQPETLSPRVLAL